MAWIKRTWTAKEADEWTKEDLIACIFSCLAYILLAIGIALSLLLQWQGYLTLAIGIVAIFLMYFVINPKLKATSTNYEKKQKQYLEELEKTEEWKE